MWKAPRQNVLFRISPGVWAIGVVSLFLNFSGVILFLFTPLYLSVVLQVGLINLGFIEGFLEMVSWVVRFFSGYLSDYFHKRKPLLVFSTAVQAAARCVFAFLPGIHFIMGARTLERVGNGIQASPREALVGDLAPQDLKGACYGLRQSLSVVGSFVGAAVAMVVMYQTNESFQMVFIVAALPSLVALFIIYFFVKESSPQAAPLLDVVTLSQPSSEAIHAPRTFKKFLQEMIVDLKALPRRYWYVVLIASLFMLSNYSGAFQFLRAKEFGVSLKDVPQLMIVQNLMATLVAFPTGRLSDKMDRRYLLAVGMSLVIVSNFMLSIQGSVYTIFMAFAVWGVQLGMTQSLIMAKIADTAPEQVRGTAFGVYYLLTGITLLLTNTLSGYLADISIVNVFIASAVWASVALCLLPFMGKQKNNETLIA